MARVHKCTVKGCSASFAKRSNMVYHLRQHKGERPFVCEEPDCDKSYTNSSHLRRHMSVSHGEKKDQQVMCEFEGCGLAYANRYSLKKHWNAKHNEEKYSFKCSECSQGFHRKRLLQQHSYIHTGEAPFRCDDCLQGFTTFLSLNKHKRRHRTYTCECGEVFAQWSMILAHRKTCAIPKFQCHICDKAFDHSPNLRIHLAVHADQSKRVIYSCTYEGCKRSYYHKKNLTSHVNIVHKKINENSKFPCTYPGCGAVLKTKVCLKNHLTHHSKWIDSKKAIAKRRTRFDKGQSKTSMALLLSGVETRSDVDNEKPESVASMPSEIETPSDVDKEQPKKSAPSMPSGVESPSDVDKEQPERSMASMLSGVETPSDVDNEKPESVASLPSEVESPSDVDKEQPKRSMASMLSGVESPINVAEESVVTTNSAVGDTELLDQSDLTLTQLYRQINSINKTIVSQG